MTTELQLLLLLAKKLASVVSIHAGKSSAAVAIVYMYVKQTLLLQC